MSKTPLYYGTEGVVQKKSIIEKGRTHGCVQLDIQNKKNISKQNTTVTELPIKTIMTELLLIKYYYNKIELALNC